MVDGEGCLVVDGEIGDLLICGFYMICVYYNDLVVNVCSFIEDGFYCIGDCV